MSSQVATTQQFAMCPAEIIFADISRSAKTVWSAMALNASPTKRDVWVNATSLGRKLHCTTRYIRMCIDELEDAGYLNRTKKKYKGRFRYYRLFQSNQVKPAEKQATVEKPAIKKKVEIPVKTAPVRTENVQPKPSAHESLAPSKPCSLQGIEVNLHEKQAAPLQSVQPVAEQSPPAKCDKLTSINNSPPRLPEENNVPQHQSKNEDPYDDIPMPEYMKRQIEEMHKSGARGVVMKAFKLYQDYRAEVRARRRKMTTQ